MWLGAGTPIACENVFCPYALDSAILVGSRFVGMNVPSIGCNASTCP